MQVFHGTLSKNLPSIQKNGLVIGRSDNKHIHGYDTKNQISLSTTYNDAFYYSSLFANGLPITILIINLDNDINLQKGVSFTEKIIKENIPVNMITGAYLNDKIIKLNQLKQNINYINYDLLLGADKKIALTKYINEHLLGNYMKKKETLEERIKRIHKQILREEGNYSGFPETITHPTFGIMKIGRPFKIKGRTYYTYESKNNVIHADIEIANMYNNNSEK